MGWALETETLTWDIRPAPMHLDKLLAAPQASIQTHLDSRATQTLLVHPAAADRTVTASPIPPGAVRLQDPLTVTPLQIQPGVVLLPSLDQH